MQRYDSYKDSGVEWLGEIPSHWEIQPIRALFHDRREKNIGPKTDYILSVMKDIGVIPYDEKGNVGNKKSENIESYKVVYPGDLVVNKMNAIIGSLGISKYHGALSQVYFVLHPRDKTKANTNYLGYLFKVKPFQQSLIKISKGMMELRESIEFDEFKKLCLPLPTLEEQERVVTFLDEKTAEIDAAIAKKERLIELLKEQKNILINRAVTRGLNPDVAMRDSGVEWIGEIPAHWAIGSLNHVANIFAGGTPDRGRAQFWNGDIPWLKTGEINFNTIYSSEEFITTSGLKNSAAKIAPPGTVLMAMYGQGVTRGRVAILGINSAFNQACVAISPSKKIITEFIYYYFYGAYSFLRDSGNETSQMNLSSGSISKFKITVPPIKEQIEITKYLDCQVNEIDQIITRQQILIEKILGLKSIIISSAVAGKVKV
jgi:type I restriction enzyme S subunit